MLKILISQRLSVTITTILCIYTCNVQYSVVHLYIFSVLCLNFVSFADAENSQVSNYPKETSDNETETETGPETCRSPKRNQCELPPSDPGNLLDAPDVSNYLSFHQHNEHSVVELCGGCCDALLVYAAETSKRSKLIISLFYFLFIAKIFVAVFYI